MYEILSIAFTLCIILLIYLRVKKRIKNGLLKLAIGALIVTGTLLKYGWPMSTFQLTRLAFLLCSFFLVAHLFAKKPLSKPLKIVFCIILIVLYQSSTLFPFESFFLRFNSPTDAFNYYHNEEIIKVISNSNCAVILADTRRGRTYSHWIQDESGWTVIVPNAPAMKSHHPTENVLTGRGSIKTTQFASQGKMLILVHEVVFINHEPVILTISDSLDSQFHSFETVDAETGARFYYYYTFIDIPIFDYELVLNNQRYQISH